jgi:hypothetical protein
MSKLGRRKKLSQQPKCFCPGCGNGFDIEYEWEGQEAECPSCGTEFTIPRQLRLEDDPGASSPDPHVQRDVANTVVQDGSVVGSRVIADARAALLKKMQGDAFAYRHSEQLEIKADGIHIPVWAFELDVHCTWHGEYSEQRAVTKYRDVQREVRDREGRVVSTTWEKEPYTDYETIWHPCNGIHDFHAPMFVPATPEVSLTQLLHLTTGYNESIEQFGSPNVSGFKVIQKQLDASASWQSFNGQGLLDALCQSECSQFAESLTSVSSTIKGQETLLVYVPGVVLSYAADGNEYLHYFNSRTGMVSGDCPVDFGTFAGALRKAKATSDTKGLFRNLFGFSSLVPLFFAGKQFFLEEPDMEFAMFMGGACLFCWVMCRVFSGDPFGELIAQRHDALCRLFMSPPARLRGSMYAGMAEDQVSSLLGEMSQKAGSNELAAVDLSVPQRAAEVLAQHA